MLPRELGRRDVPLAGVGPAALGAGLLPLLAGCAGTQLIPVGTSADREISVVERSGIELTARVRPGLQHLPARITPIRINLTNQSGEGIYFDPQDVEFVLGAGQAPLETLLPEELPPPRPLGLGIDPTSPYASARSAPAAAGAALGYFGLTPLNGFAVGVWHDPMTWAWLMNTAFERSFIDAGESRSGYIYLKTPPQGLERIVLRVRVRSGAGSGAFETLEIPYATD